MWKLPIWHIASAFQIILFALNIEYWCFANTVIYKCKLNEMYLCFWDMIVEFGAWISRVLNCFSSSTFCVQTIGKQQDNWTYPGEKNTNSTWLFQTWVMQIKFLTVFMFFFLMIVIVDHCKYFIVA